MTDSKVDKSQKSTDIEHKSAKKQDESQALTVKREDLEGTQKELDAALVASCLASNSFCFLKYFATPTRCCHMLDFRTSTCKRTQLN